MRWSGARSAWVSKNCNGSKIGRRAQRRLTARRRVLAAVEDLESRLLLSHQPTDIVPHSKRPFTTFDIPAASSDISPPYTPAEIQTAFNLNDISFNGVTGNGAGQTIAIIDAYNDPDLASDANTFSSTYGLPQFTIDGDSTSGPNLTIENEYGSTSNLPPNSTPGVWDTEESLDVEWAHVVAPEANLILIEGNSYSNNDFAQFIANETVAIDTAKATPGVSVVSMSFGVPIYSGETAIDSVFTSPSAQQGITFFAATGDSGTPEGYPADSPDVVGVGGISLTINGDGSVDTETGWSGGGGGISPYEAQPVWQGVDAKKFSATQRTTPDVSWLADPNTGVDILDTFYNASPFTVGGTSLATPMWAALTSIADQGRTLAGLPTLDGPTQTLPMLYTLPSSDFYDVTTGNNGLAAGPGYDLVTGLGTPIVPSIVSDMASAKFVYVDSSAPAAGQTGASWANAYTSFSPVLAAAPSSREYVLVGQGTYVPGMTFSSTFQLQNDLSIIGGFAGYGASDPDSSGSAYTTTLSGNLGDGQIAASVVTASGTNSTALLEGVTISGGSGADGGGLFDSGGDANVVDCDFTSDTATDGGAAYFINASPSLLECTFTDDTATDGGGIYVAAGSSAALMYCTFLTDSATIGGGVYDAPGATPNLINCFYDGDTATTEGGGIANVSSAGLIFGGVFVGNSAPLGGGVANLLASPAITNCSLDANSASSDGGGMYDADSSSPAVTNCVFWLDSASSGNEIFNADSGSAPAVTYSDVDGTYSGTANINSDPLFVQDADPSAGNYGDLDLQPFSPCINAGNNAAVPASITTDAAGRARIIGGVVDMGAYESPTVATYVDAISPGPTHNGASWATAYTSLQQALSVASTGFSILVAQGTYTPGGSASDTFQLIDGVSILGGYAGYGTANPNARNIEAYPTILSGKNVNYHVVTGSGVDATALISGFTITGGNADGSGGGQGIFSLGGDDDGGGIYEIDGSPTIAECTISGDSAENDGGGIYNGGYYAGSSPTIINCNISGDSAGYGGGGIYTGGLYAGAPSLLNCKLQNDTASYYGGAIDCGGLLFTQLTTLINCTIEGDSARHGSAIYGVYTFSGYQGADVDNSIIYGDGNGTGVEGNVYFDYSDVQGGTVSGDGNISANPQFVSSTDLQLQPDSPCINAGSNSYLPAGDTTDLAGNPRVYDLTVDMGAYEAQSIIVDWTGNGDGINWSDGANWSTSRVPDQYETASIPTGVASLTVASGSFSVDGLTSGSPIKVASGGTLALAGTATFTGGGFTVNSGGALQIGIGGQAGSVTGTVHDNGTVIIDRSDAAFSLSTNFSGTGALTISGPGTMTLTGSNTFTGPTTINAGMLVIGATSALPAGGTVVNNAALDISAGVAAAPVTAGTITGSGALNIQGFLKLSGSGTTSQQSALSIGSGGTLDVTSNRFFIDYGASADPISAVQSYVSSGYAGGKWNGTGIISSSVAAENASQSASVYGVGYADGADGIANAVSAGQIEIMPTLDGDAKLQGSVSFGDYQTLAQYFGKAGFWDDGNFTAGSTVDFGDYQMLAQNFGKTSALNAATAVAPPIAAASAFDSAGSPAGGDILDGVIDLLSPFSDSVLDLAPA